MTYHCNILQWPPWYQDADGPSSANLGIQDICHENHTVRCWVSVKMFKDQNTEIGAWISLNLRIALFSPELSMSSPRMSTFPTWQFGRIRVKKNSKSSVHPLHILKSTLHVMLHHKVCFWVLSEKLCSWQEKQWCPLSKQARYKSANLRSQRGYTKAPCMKKNSGPLVTTSFLSPG